MSYEVRGFISYMTVCINVDVLSRTKIYDHMQYRNIYVHVQSTCTSYKYLVYTNVVHLMHTKPLWCTYYNTRERAAETSLAHNKEGASCS